MPWLTIIMAVLSFFLTKKSGGSTAQAAGAAALAGTATYAVTHGTAWGKENLGKFDGVDMTGNGHVVTKPLLDKEGNKIPKKDADGNFVKDEDGNLVYETQQVVENPKYDSGLNSVSGPPTGTTTQSGAGGLSDFWKSLGVAGQTAVGAGVGVVAAKSLPNWVVPAALLLGGYLLLKD